jgi:hypothetical protein
MDEPKKMIEYWIDLVQSMEVKTAIASLDSSVQDLYCHVDPESTVCTKKKLKSGLIETIVK